MSHLNSSLNTDLPLKPVWVDSQWLRKIRGLNISRPTLYRMVRDGRFPAPIKLSNSRAGRLFWKMSDIELWETQKLAERTNRDFTSNNLGGRVS